MNRRLDYYIKRIDKALVVSTFRFLCVLPIAAFFHHHFSDVWLISERPDQARDNGYCFFKYLREKQPEQKVYYLIDKSSKDYQKIADYGSIIGFNSWKHYFFYCATVIHISAHIGGCQPTGAKICRVLNKVFRIKDVFIPHGVSYGISDFCLAQYTNVKLFICSGQMEYENVLENYGYEANQVAYTGFPRLDYWHDRVIDKNMILVMPTWRRYLAQNKDTDFQKTDYYLHYKELIDNEELQTFLIKNDLQLYFYLHNDMQKYVDYLTSSCPNIKIVRSEEYDIQSLLKSAAILITDYSSVHFDFAYMDKPVIYYQFDQAEFYEKQYQQSRFVAERDGFGDVVYNIEDLVSSLEASHSQSFHMDERYYKRMRTFYQIYDNKNCERVFKTICERLC